VLAVSKLPGVNVSVVPLLLTLIVPATGVLPADTVIALLATLVTPTGALTTTFTLALTGTPVVPFGGLTVTSVGAVVTDPPPVVNVQPENGRHEPVNSKL